MCIVGVAEGEDEQAIRSLYNFDSRLYNPFSQFLTLVSKLPWEHN